MDINIPQNIIKATFSSPNKESKYIKGKINKIGEQYQISLFTDKQAFHKNYSNDELNDQINIIDNMELVRPLKEIKPTQNLLVAYNLRQIASNEYNLMKDEFDKILATNSNNINKLLYIKYDIINGSLLFFGDKDSFRLFSLSVLILI